MDDNTKNLVDKGEMLPLMESFYTIQGEGFHKGTAAYFIRLGGCDVVNVGGWRRASQLSFTSHQWQPTDIVKNTKNFSDTVVITGGEPLMWDMTILTKLLNAKNKSVHIETSGAYDLTGNWDWICLSPKKRKLPKKEIYQVANELKMIIYNKSDFEFAEKEAAKVNSDCVLFLQPEWSKRDLVMPLIVDYVMQNPKWKVSLQTHKYLNIP